MFPGGWTLQQSKKNWRNQADQTKFLKTILTCEGVLRFVDVFVLHKTPQGVGVEQWSIVSSMSTGSCCSPWWINSCNPSLGFDELLYWSLVWIPHQEKVVELVYVWWLPESYDLKYTVEVWTGREIGKILFPNRSMPWTALWCGDGRDSRQIPIHFPLYCCTSLQIFSKYAAKLCAAAFIYLLCSQVVTTRNRSFHKLFFHVRSVVLPFKVIISWLDLLRRAWLK